jgi:hypothetical protein
VREAKEGEMITAGQRGAGVAKWSQMTLAQSAGYDVATITDFEAERCALLPEICSAIRRA